MTTVRHGVPAMRAIGARLQRRRTPPLALWVAIAIFVTACGDGPNVSDPSTSSRAANRGNAAGQARAPAANQGSAAQAVLPTAGQGKVAVQASAGGQVAPLATAAPGPANLPAASQATPAGPAALPGTEEFGLTKAELVKSIERVEASIAQCMRNAGFEYIAVDYNTVRRGMVADKSLPGLGERQYVAQFGYGISTLYTGLSPQLADATTPAKIGLGERNVRIFNNLSPADQVAYNRTLFGKNTDATFAVALETEDFSRTGGCTRAAIEQVFRPEQVQVTYRNPLDALIEQDPRMIAALAAFADCVRKEGFNYHHPNEIETDIKNRLYAITSGAPPEALSADARAALAQLQGEERAVAAVAYDCESSLLDPVEGQIERELYARPVQ